jgi:ubiquinone/menaquinone biosynthesis C-methylase UbiE
LPSFYNTSNRGQIAFTPAPFGLLLLNHVPLKPNQTVVDIGSGAGFPLLELAGRLGPSSKLYGIDPWEHANARAWKKIRNYGLTNVEILACGAEQIPLPSDTVDLVVSNLGINNFDQPQRVFIEAYRILKPGGKLILTTNLVGHWREFYQVFEQTLQQLGNSEGVDKLKKDEAHRGTVESVAQLFTDAGFEVSRHVEESFTMRFLDGSAFLNHYFVKLGWLGAWKALLEERAWVEIFSALESNLNGYSERHGGLALTVPMLYAEGTKT